MEVIFLEILEYNNDAYHLLTTIYFRYYNGCFSHNFYFTYPHEIDIQTTSR